MYTEIDLNQNQPLINRVSNISNIFIACKHPVPHRGVNRCLSGASWLVRKWNNGYSHCELAFQYEGDSDKTYFAYSIEWEDILKCRVRDTYGDGTWDIYEINCDQKTRNDIYMWCRGEMSKPMNYRGFFFNFIPFVNIFASYNANGQSYFCSEFVMHALKRHIPEFQDVVPHMSNPQSVKDQMDAHCHTGLCVARTAITPEQFYDTIINFSNV